MYINKLDYIVNWYNKTYHSTFETRPLDEMPSTYIDSGVENNDKDPKFKVSSHVRRCKDQNIFPKGYNQNRSEEVFLIKKFKNNVPWTHVIDLLDLFFMSRTNITWKVCMYI